MNFFHTFVLGIFQGLTEFIPVSSAAHLILIPWFFNWKAPELAMVVALQMGTLVALFSYFAGDWLMILRGGLASILERKIGFERERLLFWLIFVGSIPAGFSAWLFHGNSEFHSPLVIAIYLTIVGFLMYWIDGKYTALRSIDELRMKDAIIIGLVQCFGVIPGVSRSGITMTAGRLYGMNREASARFAFMLSFPILVASGLLNCRSLAENPNWGVSTAQLVTGFVLAFFFGLIGIGFTLRFLRSADLAIFAWYRIGLAVVIILWSLLVRT